MVSKIQCSEIKNIQKLTFNQEIMCKEVSEIKSDIKEIKEWIGKVREFVLTAPQYFTTKEEFEEEKKETKKEKKENTEFRNKININIAFVSWIWATVMFIITLILKKFS